MSYRTVNLDIEALVEGPMAQTTGERVCARLEAELLHQAISVSFEA